MTDSNKETEMNTRTSFIKIAIVVVPALLIVSIFVALYLGATEEQEKSVPMEGDITVSEMADYLDKYQTFIGPREIGSEDGERAMRQSLAMTMGTLGSENLGYEIFSSQTDSSHGRLWRTIWINACEDESKEPVVLAFPLAGSGSELCFAYGLAEYLTSHPLKTGVRLVFYPPLAKGNLEEWIWERCGGEGETLGGFVHVRGHGPSVDTLEIFEGRNSAVVFKKLRDSRILQRIAVFSGQREEYEQLEVALSEDMTGRRLSYAKRLVEAMPAMKELIEIVAE